MVCGWLDALHTWLLPWLPTNPGPPHSRRSLLVFLALFVCKHGAQLVADSIDSVQPGLTLMILQTVSLASCPNGGWLCCTDDRPSYAATALCQAAPS